MISKKRMNISSTILSLLVIISVAGCVANQKDETIKGCWNFDEGKGNIVKNFIGANQGEIKGPLKWVDGKSGKALEFNGKDYVIIKHADYLNAPTFTVSVWTKLKDVSNYHYIIWKNGAEFPDINPTRRIDIWVEMDGSVNIMWHSEGGSEERLYGQRKITDDKWHHVVEVYDGKTIKLYVDGELDNKADPSTKLPINNEPMWIGARSGGVAATGIIDELRFYDRALSQEQIKALFTGQK